MLYDAIIIGGGHNGLVASCYLKQAMKKVLVLEQRHILGGAAQTEELFPGFHFSRFSYLCSLLRPVVMEELNMYKHGLKLFRRNISSITVTKNKGEYFLMSGDPEFTKREIAKFSKSDSERYQEYSAFLSDIISLWSKYQDQYPYDPAGRQDNFKKRWDDFKLFLTIGQDALKNKHRVNDYIQFVNQSSSQFLDHWFESDILKGTLITDGIIGEMVSIDQPASAYVLLHHVMGEVFPESKGEWAFVEGGMGNISRIFEKEARNRGVEMRTNVRVKQILLDQSRTKAIGVELEDGSKIESRYVVSNCSPRVTFNSLLKDVNPSVDPKYLNSIKHMEYNGACTKLNLAVSELPRFKCFEGTEYSDPSHLLTGTVHLGCESLGQLREGYREVSNGAAYSRNMFVDMVIPTVHDKTISPAGKHIVQCLVQYTPYKNSVWDSNVKQELTNYVLDYINEYAPNFKKSVLFADVLTPSDLERMLNMSEGNIFHGALTLDRLYANRPTNGYNSYQTPIEGLYLCGAGTHPGGGVMGAPGRNCGRFITNYGVE